MRKYKNLLLIFLLLSIILNIYLLLQLKVNKEESRIAKFEKIQNGVNYSYNFGEILQGKYNDISSKEKAEYLTAMSWSLQLSTHMLEIVEPNDDRYRKLAELFSIYSNISSSNDLGALITHEDVADEEILGLLELWLTDIKYLDEHFDFNQLSKMNSTELRTYWERLLPNLKYKNELLDKYKQSF